MTIESEITRIETNIENAYTSLVTKGATMPTEHNTNNLAACIDSVPQNSSSGAEGEILFSYFVDKEGKADTSIPWQQQGVACSTLKTVTFGGLEHAFSGSSFRNIRTISFPNLQLIQGGGMNGLFDTTYNYFYANLASEDRSQLTTINFPKLEQVQSQGLQRAFYDCFNLQTINFPLLNNVYTNSFYQSFGQCTGLKKASFGNLNEIGGEAFYQTFYNCTSLEEIIFDGPFEADGIGGRCFYDLLYNTEQACTIHFPVWAKQKIMDSNSNWIAGNRNAIILFDLHGAVITFNIVGSNNFDTYLNTTKVGNTGKYEFSYNTYCVCDKQNSLVYVNNLPTLEADTEYPLDVDVIAQKNQAKKLIIKTNEPADTVDYQVYETTIPGENITPNERALNFVNIEQNPINVKYTAKKQGYIPVVKDAVVTQQSQTYHEIFKKEDFVPFTLPELTSNGVWGGDTFACKNSNNEEEVYAAFNSKYQQQFGCRKDKDGKYIFYMYFPNEVGIETMDITYDWGYYPERVDIYTSMDDITYTKYPKSFQPPQEEIDYNTKLCKIVFDEPLRAKYVKLDFIAEYHEIRLNIDFTASQYKHYKGIIYDIKTTPTATITLGDVALEKQTEKAYRFFADEAIPDECDLKITDNGVILHQQHIKFADYPYLTPEISVDTSQQCTLTLAPTQTPTNITFTHNGQDTSGTATTYTAYKGACITYSLQFTTGFPIQENIVLTEDTTKQVSPNTIKVQLSVKSEPNCSDYYDWYVASTPNIPEHTVFKSSNKGIDYSQCVMKVMFTGVESYEIYCNRYSEYSDRLYVSDLYELGVSTQNASNAYWKHECSRNQNPINFPSNYDKYVISTSLDTTKQYYFYVKYEKDSSASQDADEAIIAIPGKLVVI